MTKQEWASLITEARHKLSAVRALGEQTRRQRQELDSGKYAPAYVATEAARLRAQTASAVRAEMAGVTQRIRAVLEAPGRSRASALRAARHTGPAPTRTWYGSELAPDERRTAVLAADTIEALVGLRTTLTLARTAPEDLDDLVHEALAGNHLAQLGELRRELRFRAATEQSSAMRLAAARLDDAVAQLDIPEVAEAAQGREELQQVAQLLDEAARAAEAGDIDRGPRWEAAAAIPDDRTGRLVLGESGHVELAPDVAHDAAPAATSA